MLQSMGSGDPRVDTTLASKGKVEVETHVVIVVGPGERERDSGWSCLGG